MNDQAKPQAKGVKGRVHITPSEAFVKTTVLEVMVTRELADPFRRDALSKPVRYLDKYKGYV